MLVGVDCFDVEDATLDCGAGLVDRSEHTGVHDAGGWIGSVCDLSGFWLSKNNYRSINGVMNSYVQTCNKNGKVEILDFEFISNLSKIRDCVSNFGNNSIVTMESLY